jgi:hypothetical protein
MSQPAAWITLPVEVRQQLYDLLPPPSTGELPWDPEVHPMDTLLRPHIITGLTTWQTGLVDGREVKKWRDEAVQAGKDRVEGKFDGVLGKGGKDAAGGKSDGKDGEPNVDVGKNREMID